MTSIQPELWVEQAGQAVAFYAEAFGARVLHRVGDGDDIVAQLAVGDAAFWVAAAAPDMGRLSPRAIGGARGGTRARPRPGGGGAADANVHGADPPACCMVHPPRSGG